MVGKRNDDDYTGTKPVEERHRVDEARLAEWMQANVEGYQGPLEVQQFRGGQSNPTYKLVTPNRSYVMRRKPFGKLLPSAHAVDREFRVIAALGKQGFPVAKAYALCTDDSVIGVSFYIMSMEEGRVFWDPILPTQTPESRWAIFKAKIETLAQLHSYEPEKIGLGDFGKPGNYFARQVDRWSKQYKASVAEPIPEMERLMEWLPNTLPVQERVSVVHGDYRLDNMIFHATEPRGRCRRPSISPTDNPLTITVIGSTPPATLTGSAPAEASLTASIRDPFRGNWIRSALSSPGCTRSPDDRKRRSGNGSLALLATSVPFGAFGSDARI